MLAASVAGTYRQAVQDHRIEMERKGYKKKPYPPIVAFAYDEVTAVTGEGETYSARCKLCSVIKKKWIKFHSTSPSNLLKHVRMVHPTQFKEYNNLRATRKPLVTAKKQAGLQLFMHKLPSVRTTSEKKPSETLMQRDDYPSESLQASTVCKPITTELVVDTGDNAVASSVEGASKLCQVPGAANAMPALAPIDLLADNSLLQSHSFENHSEQKTNPVTDDITPISMKNTGSIVLPSESSEREPPGSSQLPTVYEPITTELVVDTGDNSVTSSVEVASKLCQVPGAANAMPALAPIDLLADNSLRQSHSFKNHCEQKTISVTEDLTPISLKSTDPLVLRSENTKPKTKLRQLKFATPECESCTKLDNVQAFYAESLQNHKLHCSHKSKATCCCAMKLEKMRTQLTDNKSSTVTATSTDAGYDCFISKPMNQGLSKVFCEVCMLFGKDPQGSRRGDETWRIGRSFANKAIENKQKKWHVENSKAHKLADDKRKEGNAVKIREGYPTKEDIDACTENAMIAGMFMVTHNLSLRMYPNLCAFLHLITPQTSAHPLGNQNQSRSALRYIHEANFCSLRDTIKKDLQNVLSSTRSCRQVMISADKGTAPKDITRQVVVATVLDFKGMPKEHFLGAPGAGNGDAQSTAANIKETVSEFVDLKKVAYLATDAAAYYVGEHTGAIKKMKDDPSFGNLIGLPDFCHKVERLVDKSMPQWVQEALDATKSIGAFVNDHPRVKRAIQEYVAIVGNCKFVVIPNTCDTRFAEYLHRHIDAILTNVKVLIGALPSVECNPVLEQKKIFILKKLLDPKFIAKLMCINETYLMISDKEQKAQYVSFGAMDYVSLVTELKSNLRKNAHLHEKVSVVLRENKYDGVDFHEELSSMTNDFVNTLRGRHETNDEFEEVLATDMEKWHNDLLKNCDTYLPIPEIMKHAVNAFVIKGDQFHADCFANEKFNLIDLADFHELSNCEFLKCSQECRALYKMSCCFLKEYNKFRSHFSKNFVPCSKKPFMLVPQFDTVESNDSINYVKAFSYYLAEDGFHKDLKCPNIMRLLEIVSLMKPSQSSTERVMSYVANTVKRRYESKNPTAEDSWDTVNIEVFLQCNANMVSINKAESKRYFVKKHYPTLQASKPITYRSKVVRDTIASLERNVRLPKTNMKASNAAAKPKMALDKFLMKKADTAQVPNFDVAHRSPETEEINLDLSPVPICSSENASRTTPEDPEIIKSMKAEEAAAFEAPSCDVKGVADAAVRPQPMKTPEDPEIIKSLKAVEAATFEPPSCNVKCVADAAICPQPMTELTNFDLHEFGEKRKMSTSDSENCQIPVAKKTILHCSKK